MLIAPTSDSRMILLALPVALTVSALGITPLASSAAGPGGATIQAAGRSAISGRVLTAGGAPQDDLSVIVMKRVIGPDDRAMTSMARGARTNALGEFLFSGLQPGEYLLFAHPRSLALATARLPDGRMALAPAYFPGTPDLSSARLIRVAPDEVVSGVEFAVGPGPARTIAGAVLGDDGKPIEHALVALLPSREDKVDPSGPLNAFTAVDGTFTITGGVAAGRYRLDAFAPDAPATDAIAVGPDGKTFAMPLGPAVSITVEIQKADAMGLRIVLPRH